MCGCRPGRVPPRRGPVAGSGAVGVPILPRHLGVFPTVAVAAPGSTPVRGVGGPVGGGPGARRPGHGGVPRLRRPGRWWLVGFGVSPGGAAGVETPPPGGGQVSKICEHCNLTFQRPPGRTNQHWAARRYCSHECSRRARQGGSVWPRLWSRVAIDDADKCWVWQGYCKQSGHGQIGDSKRRGATRPTHQVAWEFFNGRPVAAGKQINHHCDNPPCCNPRHLYEGTAQDNGRDAVERGRVARGAALPHTKLTPEQVREIRQMDLPQSKIAEQFGISPGHVSAIRSRKEWRWVQ